MSVKFSLEFKEQLIEKALQRKDGESLKFIAENENVGLSTLTRWMKESRVKTPLDTVAKRPNDWTKEERFSVLMASGKLQPNELQGFCRNKGLFQHHLDSWKNEFLNNTNTSMQKTTDKRLNAKIQELEREISRKDKVIVEQAALLVLGKKMSAFWEEKKAC